MHDHFLALKSSTRSFAVALMVWSAIGSPTAVAADRAPPTSAARTTAAPPATGASAAQNPLLAEQNTLFEQLDEFVKKRETLMVSMRKLDGDQREAVTLQVRDMETEIRRLLGQLTDLAEKTQQEGLETTTLSQRVGNHLQAEAKLLRSNIEALEADVVALQKDQEKLDATELVARKDRIAKQTASLDAQLTDLYDNAERSERLGLDTSADNAYLDKMLQGHATKVAGEIKRSVDQLASLRDQLNKAADADKAKVQAQIAALQTEKDGATESLTNIVALMKKRGLDGTTYSELLLRTTGQINIETLSVDVAKSFLARELADAKTWLHERGPTIALKALVVTAIFLGFWMLAGLVGRGVRRAMRRSGLGASLLMQRFAARMAAMLVMLIGVLVVLWQFNVEVGHMLAGLGIAGFIVGFALQDVLGNFAAGIMILIYRPYDVGDWIEVPEAVGKVQHMNLVSTTILTGDNQKLLVPNGKIWGSIIRNVTSEDTRRVDLTFGIGYSDDISRAEQIFKEILEADERALGTPEPLIRLTELGESSVNFTVRAWCRTADYWELRWHITRRVKERFDEEGVSIPFPQRDVHLYRAGAPATADPA
jgi:small conductance mechanosensitive channel